MEKEDIAAKKSRVQEHVPDVCESSKKVSWAEQMESPCTSPRHNEECVQNNMPPTNISKEVAAMPHLGPK
eukprot:3857627-Karenia_brevis.AAC.1